MSLRKVFILRRLNWDALYDGSRALSPEQNRLRPKRFEPEPLVRAGRIARLPERVDYVLSVLRVAGLHQDIELSAFCRHI